MFVTHLECAYTGEQLPADTVQNLSSAGKPLLVRYDLAGVKKSRQASRLEIRSEFAGIYEVILDGVTRPNDSGLVQTGNHSNEVLLHFRRKRS